MGSGKTYWGKQWAENANIPFYDLDEVIEKNTHKNITQIFEEDGEDYFREIETKTLLQFSNIENAIIACGGGTPCFNNNVNWMNNNGITIYLCATPNQILQRVITEQATRPIIKSLPKNELLEFIKHKLAERDLFYNKAQAILPVETITVNTINQFI